MPFVSIYSTNQGPIPEIFAKILRIGGVDKLSLCESAIMIFFSIFFLLHPHESQSKFIG
jgi:hypothetical protein